MLMLRCRCYAAAGALFRFFAIIFRCFPLPLLSLITLILLLLLMLRAFAAALFRCHAELRHFDC